MSFMSHIESKIMPMKNSDVLWILNRLNVSFREKKKLIECIYRGYLAFAINKYSARYQDGTTKEFCLGQILGKPTWNT